MNVAQRVAALERRLAAELARSAGLQDELARRDVRIRRLEVTALREPLQLGACVPSSKVLFEVHMLLAWLHCMPCGGRQGAGRHM